MSKTAAVIWLHDLQDSAQEWYGFADIVGANIPFASWTYPEAETMHVTALGSEESAWFDLQHWPVSAESSDGWFTSSPDDHQGLPAAVEMIHQLITELQNAGTPANRIILGGFGQGGSLAIMAALQHSECLGGVLAMSAWLPTALSSISKEVEALPILLLHGREDDRVWPGAAEAAKGHIEALGPRVEVCYFDGLGHKTCLPEVEQVTAWLEGMLPPVVVPEKDEMDLSDMSPEARQVWDRLVAETAEDEDRATLYTDEQREIPIENTVEHLVPDEPGALVLRHIKTPPEEFKRPVWGALARITCIATAPAGEGVDLLHLQDVELAVGSAELPDAVSRALESMVKGEHATILALGAYAYGEAAYGGDLPAGLSTLPLGRENTILFDITLHSWREEMFEGESREDLAGRLKAAGTAFFKDGMYRRALHAYNLAKRDFDCLSSGSSIEISIANEVRLPCILNIAACHQKLGEWRQSEVACSLALMIDSQNVKALFRRTQAHRELGQMEAAWDDLRYLKELDPQNSALPRETALLQKEQRKQDKRAKNTFAKMFAP